MVGFGSCAGAVVDFDVDMNEVLIIGPERVLQTTPGVYFGEAPRAAASFNRFIYSGDDRWWHLRRSRHRTDLF